LGRNRIADRNLQLNDVNPHAWLADTPTKLVNLWPASRIDELMLWAYAKDST